MMRLVLESKGASLNMETLLNYYTVIHNQVVKLVLESEGVSLNLETLLNIAKDHPQPQAVRHMVTALDIS
jgi:hypothetical protein